MLSRKLLRHFGRNVTSGERTVVALGTFSACSITSAHSSRPRSPTSFCPSLSISSLQSECDSEHGNWMRFKNPEGHSFRHNPINVGFVSLITSPLSQLTTTCRQLHTSQLQPSATYFRYKHSTLLMKENSRISHRLLLSTQGKGDQGENNNNINDPKTSSGSEQSGSNPSISTITIKDGLQTRASVGEFLENLTDEQKGLLYHSLNVDVLRDKYEGHLGSSKFESHHYLSRFGRPTAAVGEEPTGTLCEVPPTWLHTRLDEKMHPPTAGAIWAVGLKNALPFIGFGFLDNLIMILAGDYIDVTIGTTFGISTMAAAALGNTISDVAGIGSAWYVEDLAKKVGIKDPQLTPSQFASWPVRWASNGGRAIGVVIGCLLGMVPLLFLPSPEEKEKEEKQKIEKEKAESTLTVGTATAAHELTKKN